MTRIQRLSSCRFFATGSLAVVLVVLLLLAPLRAAESDHPLDTAIAYAKQSLERMDNIRDYSALFVKRERSGDKLGGHVFARIKMRHEPFSVYLKYVKPNSVKGREVIYVENQNRGKLLAHDPSYNRLGSLALAPNGMMAMRGRRYPITDIGFRNLIVKLIERAEVEKRKGSACRVAFRENATVSGRSASVLEVERTKRNKDDKFFRVRIFIDDELQIPIRCESHDWPDKPGGEPLLLEEYTYLDVKLNLGLTDADFEIENTEYSFPALNPFVRSSKRRSAKNR